MSIWADTVNEICRGNQIVPMKIVLNILLNKNYELCVLGYGIQRITIIFFYQYLDSEVSITSFFFRPRTSENLYRIIL